MIPPSAHLLPNRNLCWKVNLDLRKGVQHAVEKDGAEIRKRMLDDMLRWIVCKDIYQYLINITFKNYEILGPRKDIWEQRYLQARPT